MALFGRSARGDATERKKPAGINMAAAGTPMRTIQASGVGSTIESTSIWQTSDRITITPACACPARKQILADRVVHVSDFARPQHFQQEHSPELDGGHRDQDHSA